MKLYSRVFILQVIDLYFRLTDYMVQQEVEPVISTTRVAPNNAAAFEILIKNIGDETSAQKPFINMATLTSDGKEVNYFIFRTMGRFHCISMA